MVFRRFEIRGEAKGYLNEKITQAYIEHFVETEAVQIVEGLDIYKNYFVIGGAMLISDIDRKKNVHDVRVGGEQGAVEKIINTLDLNNIAEEVTE